MVAEYTADELADDSDDEKKIEKAEKAAERKAAKRKRALKVPAAKQRTVQAASQSPTVLPPPNQTPQRHIITPAKSRPVVGPCFACGEMGHLLSYCPKAKVGNKKMYPSGPVCVKKGDVCCSSTECTTVDVYDDGEVSADDTYVERCTWEVEALASDSICDVSVQGRLKEQAQFWKDVLRAPKSVLSVIESGYVLPLKSEPSTVSSF